jgi:imidazolonepropionase-like amidohydrolase
MNCSKCQKFKSCEHYSDYSCQHYIEKVNKPMAENKVIFEREEFRRMIQKVIPAEYTNIMFSQFLLECEKNADKYGLIRKSIVEEAEEYEKHVAETMDKGLSASIKDLEWSIRIIIGLKAENNEFKGRENQSIKRD